jgi:hypothetical protein
MVDCLHERLCMSASGKVDSPYYRITLLPDLWSEGGSVLWIYAVFHIEAVPVLTDPQLVSRDLFNSLLGSILPVMSGL